MLCSMTWQDILKLAARIPGNFNRLGYTSISFVGPAYACQGTWQNVQSAGANQAIALGSLEPAAQRQASQTALHVELLGCISL